MTRSSTEHRSKTSFLLVKNIQTEVEADVVEDDIMVITWDKGPRKAKEPIIRNILRAEHPLIIEGNWIL